MTGTPTTKPEDLLEFLNAVAQENGWKQTTEQGAAYSMPGGAGIHLNAMGITHDVIGTRQEVLIDLLLVQPEGFTNFRVAWFEVHSEGPHLSGFSALSHLGRDLEENQHEVWCPKDIESLFRAYDLVAHLAGLPVVFDLY